jgi:hypothetical protein
MAISDENKKRLQTLQAQQAEWDQADRDRAELQELEDLEAEALLRQVAAELEQKQGPRGKLWEIVDTQGGPVAFKCGEAVCYSKFLDATNGDGGLQLADMQDFILPNLIYPARDKYVSICLVHAAIPVLIWPLLAKLYRGVRDRATGK